MATVPYQYVKLEADTLLIYWPDLGNGDDGEPFEGHFFVDRTIEVAGTFGAGGNVRIEGRCYAAGFSPLTDPQGNDMDIASAKLEALTELVRYIRPRVTGGDGTTNITVALMARRPR